MCPLCTFAKILQVMRRHITLLVFLSTVFFSCSREETHNDLYYSTDYDQLSGWMLDYGLRKGEGHSGHWFLVADQANKYTLPFQIKLGDASQRPIVKAEVSAWLKVPVVPSGTLMVFSVDAPTGTIFWKSVELKDQLSQKDTWTQVKATMNFLSGTIGPDHILKAYFWANDGQLLMVDDMAVQLYN